MELFELIERCHRDLMGVNEKNVSWWDALPTRNDELPTRNKVKNEGCKQCGQCSKPMIVDKAIIDKEVTKEDMNKQGNTNNVNSVKESEMVVTIMNYNFDENTGVTNIEWSDGTHTSVWSEKHDRFYGFVCAVVKKLFRVDYRYDKKIGQTTVKWADGTVTKVKAESAEQADQFFGFIMALAKKATDNQIFAVYEECAVKGPERAKKAFEQAEKEAEANAKSDAKAAKRRHDWAVRREAVRIKREYEARLLANEKWGVPLDFTYSDSEGKSETTADKEVKNTVDEKAENTWGNSEV